MHPNFVTWYENAAVEIDRDAVPLRVRAIAELKTEIAGDDLPDLVRLATGLKPMGDEVPEWLENGFAKNDSKFSPAKAFELQILAGSILVDTMDAANPNPTGDAAALCLAAITLNGKRLGEYQRDFVHESRLYLEARSNSLRAKFPWPDLKNVPLTIDPAAAGNPALLQAELDKVASAIGSVHRQLQLLGGAVERRAALQQEEIDVAWWVFGGRLRRIDASVRDLDPSVVPFVCGCELADLIAVIPGPLSAPSLLDRMLDHSRDRAPELRGIGAIVGAFEPSLRNRWLDEITERIANSNVLPIAALAAKQREGADQAEWMPWFRRTLAIDPGFELSDLDVALQVYTESIARRALIAASEEDQ